MENIKIISSKYLFLLVLSTGAFVPSFSYAKAPGEGELILSAFGLVNQGVKEAESDEEDKEYHFGVGALVEANINGALGIETGALFIKRQYDYEAGGFRVVQEVNRIHVPVLARFWIGDIFSVGVGPYVAFKVGNVKDSLEFGSSPIGSIETNADDDVEFGYDIAATLNFAVNDKTGIFVEGRYSKPFDEAESTDFEALTALAGVKLSL